ncbi:hypothetical protein ANN_21759 [Periplaneta americana]|uniref:Uncharacterized protein n=1 Tax=Periplaneta americana TaxID=6978 RepID=A0ABQ8S6L6_PERAM|nr:hypothetical protein ANN_21759 [Periplaneta americana]
MAGLCEGGNEPPGSLKARKSLSVEAALSATTTGLVSIECGPPVAYTTPRLPACQPTRFSHSGIDVRDYFENERENKGSLLPLMQVVQRRADACDVNKCTVSQITTEKYGNPARRRSTENYGGGSEPNITSFIKMGRLRWAGHIMRLGDSRPAIRVLRYEPGEVDEEEDQRSDGRMASGRMPELLELKTG